MSGGEVSVLDGEGEHKNYCSGRNVNKLTDKQANLCEQNKNQHKTKCWRFKRTNDNLSCTTEINSFYSNANIHTTALHSQRTHTQVAKGNPLFALE